MGVGISLEALNMTELLELIRRHTGVVVKRSVTKERLIQIITSGETPLVEEESRTTASRRTLELFIKTNWDMVQSQLPCKGDKRGQCTVYPCPEGRHMDCYLAVKPHIIATMKVEGDEP